MNQVLTEAEMTGPGNTTRDLALPAEGRLEGVSIPELLWSLGVRQVTGALILEREAVRKVIYLREGRVVFAASTDPEDRLGPFLLRRGEVGLSDLLEAGSNVLRGRRLGQVLVEQNVLDSHGVMRAVIDQVREIALSVFAWREGRWRLTRASLAGDESITLDLSMEDLVLAGIRRVRDWRWIHRAVGGPRAVFRATNPELSHNESLGLTERAILDQLRTTCRVELLCREVYAPSYDIYRALWALMIAGHVTRLDETAAYESLGGPGEGFIAPGTVSQCLLDLGDRSFSGVLRLFDGQHEGAIYLHRGQIEFATTNDPEQSLVAYLLRRGIISDRDREEAVRKLISGKRIGRLLAEGGALGEEELQRFVREQLLEVCCSLVRWKTGEYQIEDGLPSEEEISLARSPEDVIAISIGMNTAFAPMWEEIGGLSSLYRLTPNYLDRLDRMTLRPQLWEVVSQLKVERTVGEICESRPESDFEVCRMLHALLAVRVIERVSEEEIVRRARERQVETPPPTAPESDFDWSREHSEHVADAAEASAPLSEESATPVSEHFAAESAAEMAPELFSAASSSREGIIPQWKPVIPEAADDGASEDGLGDEPTAEQASDDDIGRVAAVDEAEQGVVGDREEMRAPTGEPEAVDSYFGKIAASEPSASNAEDSVDERIHSDDGFRRDQVAERASADEAETHDPLFGKIAAPDPVASEAEDIGADEAVDEAAGETTDTQAKSVHDQVAERASADEAEAHDPLFGKIAAPDPVASDIEESKADDAIVEEAGADSARYQDALWKADPARTLKIDRATMLPSTTSDGEPLAVETEDDGRSGSVEIPVRVVSTPPVDLDATLEDIAAAVDRPSAEDSDEALDQELAPTVPDGPHASAESGSADVDAGLVSDGAQPPIEDHARDAASAEEAVDIATDVPQVEVSEEISVEVERFNERHAVVFRHLRVEIGAGVRNFVITCGRRLGDRGEVFEGLAPDRDGRFDTRRLGEAIASKWPGSPREPLDSLIETEVNLVRGLLPYDRLAAIEKGLRALGDAQD